MTGATFPEVDWIEGWPRDRSKSAMTLPILMTVIFLALAVTPILGAPWDAGPVVSLGSVGGLLAFLGLAYFFASMLRGYLPLRNAGIVPTIDDEHGAGIRLAVDHREMTRLIPALVGMSVYGLCGWLDWRAGGDSLLPMSRSNSGGATFALIFAVVLALAVLLFSLLGRWAIQVTVHPAGIVRRHSIPFGKEKREFVSWGDITSLTPGTFSSGRAKNLPVLNINLSDISTPPGNRMFDQVGILGIPLYTYRCDPNSAFSILAYLHGNPKRRDLLTRPDVPQWFLRVGRGDRGGYRARKVGGGEA
ncbi:hypothetical protein [Nocardia sp. NPDC019395]|uniref:hypothetical protein n=1 Tax=Nocardia sp. NPDC019395 TaxID=3154686 RepID=UPI0033CCB2A8